MDLNGKVIFVSEFKNTYNWKVGSSVYGELVVNEIHDLLIKEAGDMDLSVSMGIAVKFDSFHRKEDVIKEAEEESKHLKDSMYM